MAQGVRGRAVREPYGLSKVLDESLDLPRTQRSAARGAEQGLLGRDFERGGGEVGVDRVSHRIEYRNEPRLAALPGNFEGLGESEVGAAHA